MDFASQAFLVFRWAVLVSIVLALIYTAKGRVRWRWVTREVVIALGAYFFYFLVRGFTAGDHTRAFDNAKRLIDFESSLGLFQEARIQSLIIDHDWAITLSNWMYIWGHWPFVLVVAAWLLLYHPGAYHTTRNAFLLSGAIGLVLFATFPVAPPRLLELGFVDTVTENSSAYRVLQPQALVNQVAAMPSLHFGWNLLVGIALIRVGRGPVRLLGFATPAMMAFGVVATANHFIVDAVVGGALCLLALMCVEYAKRRLPTWWERFDPVVAAHESPTQPLT